MEEREVKHHMHLNSVILEIKGNLEIYTVI